MRQRLGQGYADCGRGYGPGSWPYPLPDVLEERAAEAARVGVEAVGMGVEVVETRAEAPGRG